VDKETNEEMLVTQYEGSVIEEIGLIKMDFLGLKTLSIIKEALSNIKKSKGIDLDIDAIPIDDKETYELSVKVSQSEHFSSSPQECKSICKRFNPLNSKT